MLEFLAAYGLPLALAIGYGMHLYSRENAPDPPPPATPHADVVAHDAAVAALERASRLDDRAATELQAQAQATAEDLVARWPEWMKAHMLLEGVRGMDDYRAYDQWKAASTPGAEVRRAENISFVLVSVAACFGALLLAALAVRGAWQVRAVGGMAITPVAAAQPGYVALQGTVELVEGAAALDKPRFPGVAMLWTRERDSWGNKAADTSVTFSTARFVLRDAGGAVVIDPMGLDVEGARTLAAFPSDTRRIYLEYLAPGDTVFALGELAVESGARVLRAPADGRRFLVSMGDRADARAASQRRLFIGLIGALLLGAVTLWLWWQRYGVLAEPPGG